MPEFKYARGRIEEYIQFLTEKIFVKKFRIKLTNKELPSILN